ncbi:MAG: molybdenum cofactor guanylyltransferase, partial [Planctomycetota bacterium]|nr:molybdenum cofactor guanylyltransferase [Planctomycetota bacterium]
MNVTGYVLAGGKSSRFGSDKARAILDGVPLIVRVAVTVAEKCRPVIAVADVVGKYDDLGLLTIADRRPGLGPLTGLETALAHRLAQHGPGWLLLVSCDLAAVKAEWIDTILRQLPPDERNPASAAVAFRSAFWQPFPAAFHT